ncbi:hypothetical protein CPB84DRAFT_1855994 [Gymnopilus junonius]|uniref:Uncharacterized protein n=1 Tax=Gymnopilus junonius TaxID=109634 RepID=A0A9P5N7I4_GYMJU|nr:hypothetical protein CPB84DRAFT_1855994 [Gymnopilus junonius]
MQTPAQRFFSIPELLSLAVDNVRVKDLNACSGVNLELRIICQERIFNHIKLSYRTTTLPNLGLECLCDNDGGMEFLKLLEVSPQLASYVRRIDIDIHHVEETDSIIDSIMPNFSFYEIFPKLGRLRTILVDCFMDWPKFELQARLFLAHISSRVPEVNFSALRAVPLSAFVNTDIPKLKQLCISNVYEEESDNTGTSLSQVTNAKVIKLDSLDVGFDHHSTSVSFGL